MSLLKFELKKIWRQKKLAWLLVIVLLCISWVFYQNKIEQDLMKKEAEENISFIVGKADELYAQLLPLNRENRMTEEQAKQFESLNNMAQALFLWKSAIYGERWHEIPQIENDFLTNLAKYEEAGGVFTALAGVEREKAIAKNAYLVEHGLPYANETYPVTPALQMGKIATILLGPGGLLLLLLLFGNSYMSEKEQQTLLTLRTQPIRRWKLLLAKYSGMLVVMVFFLAVIVIGGWTIPNVFGDTFNDLSYPQFLETGDSFAIIPVWQHLLNVTILFLGAAAFLFALSLLIGTQLRSSFANIMFTGFITMVGVVLTDTLAIIQTPWNPFQFFRADRFLTEMPVYPIWLYAVSAFLWSVVLLAATILLREGGRGLFKSAEELKPFRKGRPKHFRALWNTSLFEWRKSRRRGLVGQSLIVLSIAVVVGYFIFAEQVKVKEKEAIERITLFIEQTETEIIPFYMKTIEELEKMIEAANEKGEDGEFIYGHNIETYHGYIESAREEAKLAVLALDAYGKRDWTPFYEYQLFNDRRIYEMQAEAKKYMQLPQSIFGYETSIAQKEWMEEHEIRPVFSGTYIPNIYDNWKPEQRREKEWTDKMNRKVDHSGLFSLYMYFRDYLYLIPLLLFMLLVGAGFAGERGKRPTLHLLKTLPITKRSLFLGKVLYSSVVAIGSAVGIFLFTVLVGTVFNRFGDWMYPVLHYHSKREVQSFDYTGLRAFEGGYHFTPLGEYLLKALLLYVCVVLFLLALTNVLGLFIRQPLAVYALTGLLSGAGYLLSWKLDDFTQYSPFLYLNIPKIANGEILALLNNPAISVYMGCAMLLGATVFLLVVAYVGLRFEKRFVKTGKSVTATV
ncbi:ABC transporter permease [Sporosarcina sp. ACRSL]|uniref:ABC transporter permease subunit n=1 Tax=Sporosarcina sp. ACRSL TaxID=2918215 RepID=UPI001EF669A1|nr:ABC transporter permease subunit [Sporosarcina sp. ACRSL]MCG7343486.1 ABC transporter permease [Sporosarcina sp. ACRSL]